MLYTRETVRDNLRNREGKRVFYLGTGDRLTPGARDYLTEQKIPILSAEQAKPKVYRLLTGGTLEEKPEHMTHLNAEFLVEKTHPRIGFRGALDTLEAEIILCQLAVDSQTSRQLEQLLAQVRQVMACDVLEKPVPRVELLGLTEQALRSRSHRPQDYYGQPHFMPGAADGEAMARLNRCRCAARAAELAACHAYKTETGTARTDILQALNRLSSAIYLLMIQLKKQNNN